MRWMDDRGIAHWLSWCSNVHPEEQVDDIARVVGEHGQELARRLISGDGVMGLGLHLGERAVHELVTETGRIDHLRATFQEDRLQPFTLNVFPQGSFHAPVVKERVYFPDWTDERRLNYTLAAGEVLARLLPQGERLGTLSTVPLGWRENGADLDLLTRSAETICRLVDAWARREAETGVRLVLAIEPEPSCALETSTDVVAWFETVLSIAARRLEPIGGAHPFELVQRHVGVCLDACHHSVVFEHPASARGRYCGAGIQIAKIQVSSALRVDLTDVEAGRAALERFTEERFLHQVMARDETGRTAAWLDLPRFLQDLGQDGRRWLEARCHFHVPVHLAGEAPLHTTRGELEELLVLEAAEPSTQHYEVETYTFSLLPAIDGSAPDLKTSLQRELSWTAERLGAVPHAP